MNVGEVCSREVYVVGRTEALLEAAREMCKRHVGAMVVVEQHGTLTRPIGIVTDRDVVRGQVLTGAELRSLKVEDVMTAGPLLLDEESDVSLAIESMSAKGVRRAPVINDSGDLVGLVSFDDLFAVLSEELTGLTRLLARQVKIESARGSA